MTLWNDKKLTIYEISSKLKLNPSTISPVIKRLALLNYIEKKRNKSDERIVFVKLTNTGENLKKKLTKVQELVSKRTELSEINYHRIKNDLKNLTKNLESENKKAS